MSLPTGYDERKALPLWDFMFGYFPDAWLEMVNVSVSGDKQHQNTGKTIMWDRTKSTDQLNTAFRHIFDYGKGTKIDTDGQKHLAKAIWRLMAQLQLDLEADAAGTQKDSTPSAVSEQQPKPDAPCGGLTAERAATQRLEEIVRGYHRASARPGK